MRRARHQYSLAPHTALNTVIIHTAIAAPACCALEEWNGFYLAMSACSVTVTVGRNTITHNEDMALIALELHLVVKCL